MGVPVWDASIISPPPMYMVTWWMPPTLLPKNSRSPGSTALVDTRVVS